MDRVEAHSEGVGHPGEGRHGVAGIGASSPLTSPPRSILIVMMSALGDAVMVLPVVNALRRAFPGTHLAWVIQPGPHALLEHHPAVDSFILFRRRKGPSPGALLHSAGAFRETAREIRRLARKQPGGTFDLLLDLQVYFKAGLLTAAAPARVKLGFDWRRTRDLNWLFTTHRIPPHPQGFAHAQDQYFEFLRHLGVDPEPVEYGLTLSPEEREGQAAFFSTLQRPACAVVLGTSKNSKDWNPEGYIRVLSELGRRFGLQPILVGGRSAKENAMAQEVLQGCPEMVVDARENDLRRLLWLLEGSALVVSPDTGPLHMARALEVPVVGLYGATNPRRSGPYELYSDLVVDGYARVPGEAYPLTSELRRGGMSRIKAEMVLGKIEAALQRYVRS